MFDKIMISCYTILALIFAWEFISKFIKQYNCSCAREFEHQLDFNSGKVHKTCLECGKKILVGEFLLEQSRVDTPLFKCKTGNRYDEFCSHKCMEGTKDYHRKVVNHLEYCCYKLKTDVNN